MADGDDLLGGLPKTRPTRRARPKAAPGTGSTKPAVARAASTAPAAKAGAKAASAARGTARPAPAKAPPKAAPGSTGRPVPPAGYATGPRPQASSQPDGLAALAGLAQQGLGLGAAAVKGVLRRLPRP